MKFKKIIWIFVLLFIIGFLIGGILPEVKADLQFEHKDAVNRMGFFDKIKFQLGLFTVAGRERGCSDYPDESGIECDGCQKTITCSGRTSLINLYHIVNGQWVFYREYEAPYTYKTTLGSGWAWECYYCPELQDECSNGQRECVTNKKTRVCINGNWQEQSCSAIQECGGGYCRDLQCIEEWSCGSWSECKDGTQYRSCTDAKNCGTTTDKQETTQSCTGGATSDGGITEGATQIGITVRQLGTATEGDLRKASCNSNSDCIEGECIKKSIFEQQSVSGVVGGIILQDNLFKIITQLFSKETAETVDALANKNNWVGFCITDYDSYTIEEDEIATKQISLTEDEYDQATKKMILASSCNFGSECESREGYDVKCISDEQIANRNKVAFKDESSWWCKAEWTDISIAGVVKGVSYLIAGPLLKNYCENNAPPDGTCRAVKEGEDFFSKKIDIGIGKISGLVLIIIIFGIILLFGMVSK